MKVVDLVHVTLVVISAPSSSLTGEQDFRLFASGSGTQEWQNVFQEADHEVALKSPCPCNVVARILRHPFGNQARPAFLKEVNDLAVGACQADNAPAVATAASDSDGSFTFEHASSPSYVETWPLRSVGQALLKFGYAFCGFPRSIPAGTFKALDSCHFWIFVRHYEIVPPFFAYTVLPGGETVGQRVGPAVAEAYRTGQVPALLPAYGQTAIESEMRDAR